MLSNIAASVIVTTYNWPEALMLTLRSIVDQSVKPDQVIVADDGSGPETGRVVEDVLRPSGLAWRHVWHEDRGVRQSRIKNLAVRYSSGSYLIFVDHDVVLHHKFVADHLSMADNNVILQGKRALLPEYYTEKVLSDGIFTPPGWWIRGLGNRKNLFRFRKMGRMFSRLKNFETSLRGCNLSMFRKDFLNVDGFDEAFDRSWGREDSDICYRLFHSGVRMRTLWFSALQYHLKHRVITNWHRERLDGELEDVLKEKRVRAKEGFSRLSSEGAVMAESDCSSPGPEN